MLVGSRVKYVDDVLFHIDVVLKLLTAKTNATIRLWS